MKHWKSFLIITLAALLFLTIRYVVNIEEKETDFKKFAVSSLYTINLPDYMMNSEVRINDGSLKISNFQKGIYLRIIEEKRTDSSLNHLDYFQQAFENYTIQLTDINVIESDNSTINGLESNYVYLTGKRLEEKMRTKIVVIEGKEHYYQIITWTAEVYKRHFEDDMDITIGSFTEL
jgi:hypothetical protein